MSRVFKMALGVMTAIGGFVDIGDLVAASATGARFGLTLAWAVVVGVIGIVLFAEMAGRVPVIWDPHPLGPAPLPMVTLVTPSSAEARHLTGESGPPGLAGVRRSCQRADGRFCPPRRQFARWQSA